MFADLSIVGVPILVRLAVVTLGVVGVAVWQRHRLHWWGEVLVGMLVVVSLTANVAGWVNRHFDYYPTLDDLLGPRTGDTNAVGTTVGDLFGGNQDAFDQHEPSVLLRANQYPQLGGWFEVGTADPDPLAAQNELVPLARAAGIDTCAVTIPGGEHTFSVWAQAFRDSLPWMAGRLELTEPVDCPSGR